MPDELNKTYPPTAEGLLAVLKRLRAPGGCPWDREQTRETLARSLAEECGELLEAIDQNDPAAICDELGDLLMNAFFQVVVAEEKNEFDLTAVMRGEVDKMIRRHAHIFGTEKAETAEDVTKIWEKIKAGERKAETDPSVLAHVSGGLSALTRAEKLQKKAGKVGFDWENPGQILDKIEEELAELREAYASGDDAKIDEEFGDLLFAAANLARFRKRRTSEELLRSANRKFERRFRRVEALCRGNGIDLASAGIEVLEKFWQQAKKEEKHA